MCFQDDASSEMTQIHLWQSYQGTFVPYYATHPHMIAGDFIKNVSTTFTGASAQVAGSNKYVIRGIKPRVIPVDYKGRELVRCQWKAYNGDIARDYGHIFSHSTGSECGGWFGNSAAVLSHILTHHLHVPKKLNESLTPMDLSDPSARPSSSPAINTATFDFARAATSPDALVKCDWNGCGHSNQSASAVNYALLARHIETHLPDASDKASWKRRHQHHQDGTDNLTPPPVASHAWLRTLVDEKGDAAGVPLGCALVMRNIARAIPQLASASEAANASADIAPRSDEDESGADGAGGSVNGDGGLNGHAEDEPKETEAEAGTRALMKTVFSPHKDRLFHAMAHNNVLASYVGIVLKMISAGGG